ncbi:MAG: hypothetical protein WCC17_10480 [Candidatus Nitrosopolaris sp.]
MFHTSMNSKTTLTFSTLVVSVASVFASAPILGNQPALVGLMLVEAA